MSITRRAFLGGVASAAALPSLPMAQGSLIFRDTLVALEEPIFLARYDQVIIENCIVRAPPDEPAIIFTDDSHGEYRIVGNMFFHGRA